MPQIIINPVESELLVKRMHFRNELATTSFGHCYREHSFEDEKCIDTKGMVLDHVHPIEESFEER